MWTPRPVRALSAAGRTATSVLPFAGGHLRQPALVQGDGRHHLHVEGAQAERAPAGLTRDRVELVEDVVERRARPDPILDPS